MRKNAFIGLLVILLVFGFIGCKDDDGNDNGNNNNGTNNESGNNNSGNNPIPIPSPSPNWNWTVVEDTTFGYTDIKGVAFGNNTWVAVGYEKIAYSNNGEIWTSVNPLLNPSFTGISFQAVTFENNRWVAVGTSNYGSSPIAAYSLDGLYWTIVDIDADISYINNIAYAHTRWIAVGYKSDNGFLGKIIYSDDNGASWTEVLNTTFDDTNIYSIAYGNNKWVAGGGNGKIAYSIDGVYSWTSVTDSKFNNFDMIITIGYGNDRFIAVNTTGKTVYSNNGETWTEFSMNIINFGNISAIVYRNNRWVAGGSNMAYSNNGINWTQVTNSTFGINNGYINDIAFGNNKWVAVGRSPVTMASPSALGKISYANH